MRLLFQTCCAPCAINSIEASEKDGYDSVTGFFYNPNIHPKKEFEKRRDEAVKYFGMVKKKLLVPEYNPDDYFGEIHAFEGSKGRCFTCWRLRMEKTAKNAKEGDFDAFTTTLLSSPYQDHEMIKDICSVLAEEHKVKFYYKDFRSEFWPAHDKARELGMYRQNYCGCVFSILDREESRSKKTAKQA